MRPIELSFQYTESDYQEFLRNYFMKNRSRMYIILAALAFIALTITMDGEVFSLQYLLSVILPIALIVFFWWWMLKFSGRRAFRMAPQMQEGRNCVIDEEQISVVGHTFTSEFKWAGVLRVAETKSLFLAFNSKASAVMLPKRAFSPEQLADFKALVERTPDLQVKWRS